MHKLKFNIVINAPVEKVYNIMLENETYRAWTKEFNVDSHYVGSWEKGSKILFIGTGQNGEVGGMVSRIRENIPNKFVSIEHVGMLEGDREITEGEKVEGWAGALENYYFEDRGGATEVRIEMDSDGQMDEYMNAAWPRALAKLKSLCEQG